MRPTAEQQVAQEIGLVKDSHTTRYVRAVGARLAEAAPPGHPPLRFFVADTAEPNAFALEGGEIFVSRGLLVLLNSEDELANILAHEVGHVVGRHHAKQRAQSVPLAPLRIATKIGAAAAGVVSPQLGGAVAMVGNAPTALASATYSRSQEAEADKLGQSLAASAGWDPRGMADVMTTLGREAALHGVDPNRRSFFASHPTSPDREQRAVAWAATLTAETRPSIAANRGAFLGELQGLLVGKSGAQGVFVGTRFIHPDLDFALVFPEAWTRANAPSFVGALSPDEASAVLLQIVAETDDPGAGADALFERSGVELDTAPEALRIAGLPALRASAAAGRGRDRTRLVLFWIAHGGRVFQVTGSAREGVYARDAPLLETSALSFRPLVSADRKQVTEGRLRVVTARDDERLDALVARSGAIWSAEQTAVANGLEIDSRLPVASPVKLAIPELYAGP